MSDFFYSPLFFVLLLIIFFSFLVNWVLVNFHSMTKLTQNFLLWISFSTFYCLFLLYSFAYQGNHLNKRVILESGNLFLGNYNAWLMIQCEKHGNLCDLWQADASVLHVFLIFGSLLYGLFLLLTKKCICLLWTNFR